MRERAQLIALGARRLEALPQVFSFRFLPLEVLGDGTVACADIPVTSSRVFIIRCRRPDAVDFYTDFALFEGGNIQTVWGRSVGHVTRLYSRRRRFYIYFALLLSVEFPVS